MRSNDAEKEFTKSVVLRPVLKLLMATLVVSAATPQCAEPVKLRSYSFCAPEGWRIQLDTTDVATLCSSKKPCATYFGSPPKGLTFVFVRPAAGLYGHAHYDGPREVVAAAPHAGLPDPEFSEVQLDRDPSGRSRKCFMSRRRLAWALAWDEQYALEINTHLFSVWARYEDDPANIGRYRAGIVEILSSLRPK